jgi:hypothetical protein
MAWYHRLRNTMRPEGVSSELNREVEFHLSERIDELVASGMSEEEARREARLRFGNPVVQKERARDRDILPWLESFVADVRYALRSLRGSPGFALVAILSLGLAIGANTAIFSLIDAVMLRSLPVMRPEELVRVTTPTRAGGWAKGVTTSPTRSGRRCATARTSSRAPSPRRTSTSTSPGAASRARWRGRG